jgi:hypothetical protein
MNEDAFLEKIQTALREEKNIPKSMREYAKINHPDVYNRFCALQSIKKKKESKVVDCPRTPRKLLERRRLFYRRRVSSSQQWGLLFQQPSRFITSQNLEEEEAME